MSKHQTYSIIPQKSLMNKPIIIDTNILIGFELWMPRRVHSIFWDNLEQKISEGSIILLDVVMDETRGDLKKWCNDQIKQKGYLTSISNQDRQRGYEINNTYPIVDNVAMKSVVDTFIIAFAERNQFMICSRESRKRPDETLHKIPDVCDALNIDIISKPSGLYSRTGLNFDTK